MSLRPPTALSWLLPLVCLGCLPAMGDTPDPAPPQTGCTATSSRVGHTATLATHSHGVSGTVTIEDDCTLVIRDFHFDGGGLDVRLVGASNRDFPNGHILTQDLRRPRGYRGEELRISLPQGTSLADIQHVAIWCFPAAENLADGAFPGAL